MENEIPKYKKRSCKTKTKKSKHKHEYKECLLIDDKEYVRRINYCIECGRIENKFMFETSGETYYGFKHILTDKEILEKYKHLPKKHVKDIFKLDNISLL